MGRVLTWQWISRTRISGIRRSVSARPTVVAKPPRLTPRERASFNKWFQAAVENGWIRKSKSRVSCALLFAPKKGSAELRTCINYIPLNRITHKRVYAPQTDRWLRSMISSHPWRTKIDLENAFYHMTLRDGDQWKAAFRTPTGTVRANSTHVRSVPQRQLRAMPRPIPPRASHNPQSGIYAYLRTYNSKQMSNARQGKVIRFLSVQPSIIKVTLHHALSAIRHRVSQSSTPHLPPLRPLSRSNQPRPPTITNLLEPADHLPTHPRALPPPQPLPPVPPSQPPLPLLPQLLLPAQLGHELFGGFQPARGRRGGLAGHVQRVG